MVKTLGISRVMMGVIVITLVITRARPWPEARARTRPNVRQNFHSEIRKGGARAKRAPNLEDFVDLHCDTRGDAAGASLENLEA